MTDILGLQEVLEGLRRIQTVHNGVTDFFARRLVGTLNFLLHPRALFGVLNMHVFDARSTSVGITQLGHYVAQLHVNIVFVAQSSHREIPIQIPDRKPVGPEFQVRMATHPIIQGIHIRNQVSTGTVSVDESRDSRVFGQLPGPAVIVVTRPAERRVGNLHGIKDTFVESVFAFEFLFD